MEYRKKPVVIEAFRYGMDSRPDWFDTKVTSNDIITYVGTDIRDSSQHYCEIKTLEGIMRGNCGDYIIKGVQGEVYPCKPDIFEMTYELASTSSQTETAMIIPEAISILKIHQQWRLGADIVMIEPKELTKAIDVLINYHIDIMNETLSSQTEISDEEIEKGAEEKYPYNELRDGEFRGMLISAKKNAWVDAIKWYREQLNKL